MEDFVVKIGIHQELAFNLYFFVLVIDKLTTGVYDEALQYMMFANEFVLVDGNTNMLEGILECWP